MKDQLIFFINKEKLPKRYHAFIIGLGNENHTADSVGPKSLKYLKVNSYVDIFKIDTNNNKISALEPGVLGQTGIETKRIIEAVTKEVNPDIIILIDSYVTKDIKYLNKTIQISNDGISPGSGLDSISFEISSNQFKIPVITIGVPTAIEIQIDSYYYYLSNKDIDDYVIKISKLIGDTLNEVLLG